MRERSGRRLTALVLLHGCIAAAPANASAPETPEDRSIPVFYERYRDVERAGDLALLRDGRVRVQHYGPVDVSRFEWQRSSLTDYTWWMQMQELRFILPAIASDRAEDRRIALSWFMRWYAVHMVPEPAMSAWGEPMTAGYRTMVLVWLLKAEEQQARNDPAVLACLRETIRAHQQDLIRPARFSEMSNHGFISALGLFESTRVAPDSAAVALALSRLESMAARAVSDAGVEMEHAAAYHFVVLDWLEQMAAYLETVPGSARATAATLSSVAARMRRAAYFLQDHAGRLPPIGDTDSLLAGSFATGGPSSNAEPAGRTLFDPESGFAIYKGHSPADHRYVVFRVPGEHADMRSHAHDDGLSVFFSLAGETILGDSGRFSYSSSPERRFVVSRRAHNTVVSAPPFAEGDRAFLFAREITERVPGQGTGWTASASTGQTTWTRTVRIPEDGAALSVEDVLAPSRPDSREPAVLEILWHLGSDVATVGAGTGANEWVLATRTGQRLRLVVGTTPPGGAGILGSELVRGRRDPLLGWYSPAHEVMREVTTLVIRVRRAPKISVTTRLEPETGSRGIR